MALNRLTPEEERVIVHHGTERPFTGEYDDFYKPGTFICRRCNAPLFSSQSKFDAGCGWPAFDDSYPNSLQAAARPRRPAHRRSGAPTAGATWGTSSWASG